MKTVLDKYGRILIPKKLREAVGLTENIALVLRQKGNQIIIEPSNEDSLFVEENGFLVFSGNIDVPLTDWIQEDRSSRDEQLLGL